MSTVAEQLRAAREARKMTLEQVAETTKIRTDHVRALEEGNFDAFSAPVYIRGMVRTYSELLKLDTATIMAQLESELGQTQKYAEPPALTEKTGGVVDSLMLGLASISRKKAVVAIGTVMLLVIAVAFYTSRKHQDTADPLAGEKPALYDSKQPLPGETLPLPGKK